MPESLVEREDSVAAWNWLEGLKHFPELERLQEGAIEALIGSGELVGRELFHILWAFAHRIDHGAYIAIRLDVSSIRGFPTGPSSRAFKLAAEILSSATIVLAGRHLHKLLRSNHELFDRTVIEAWLNRDAAPTYKVQALRSPEFYAAVESAGGEIWLRWLSALPSPDRILTSVLGTFSPKSAEPRDLQAEHSRLSDYYQLATDAQKTLASTRALFVGMDQEAIDASGLEFIFGSVVSARSFKEVNELLRSGVKTAFLICPREFTSFSLNDVRLVSTIVDGPIIVAVRGAGTEQQLANTDPGTSIVELVEYGSVATKILELSKALADRNAMPSLVGGERDDASDSSAHTFVPVPLPAQRPDALRFEPGPQGAIELVRSLPSGGFERMRATLIAKTDRLLTDIAPDVSGYNLLARVRPDLSSYLAALQDESDGAAFEIWSYGNTIRRLLQQDQRTASMPDGWAESFPPAFGERLADLVETHNVTMTLNDDTSGFNGARLGPAILPMSPVAIDAGLVVSGLLSAAPAVMDPAAARALARALSAASSASAASGDLYGEMEIATAVDSLGNALTEVIEQVQIHTSQMTLSERMVVATEAQAFAAREANELVRSSSKSRVWADTVKATLAVAAAGSGVAAVGTALVVTFAQPIIAFTSQFPALAPLRAAVEGLCRYFNVPL